MQARAQVAARLLRQQSAAPACPSPLRYEAEGQLLLVAVFHNLGKGGVGVAVQNLGLILVGTR